MAEQASDSRRIWQHCEVWALVVMAGRWCKHGEIISCLCVMRSPALEEDQGRRGVPGKPVT